MTTCNRLLDMPVHVVHGANPRCDCGETVSGWELAAPIYDESGRNLTKNRLVPKQSAIHPVNVVRSQPEVKNESPKGQ